MGSVLSTLLSSFFGWFFGLFASDKKQELGHLEVTTKVQEETIHELEVDKTVSDRIDNMSDTERVLLATAINAAKP